MLGWLTGKTFGNPLVAHCSPCHQERACSAIERRMHIKWYISVLRLGPNNTAGMQVTHDQFFEVIPDPPSPPDYLDKETYTEI